jgi:hypothetical protein
VKKPKELTARQQLMREFGLDGDYDGYYEDYYGSWQE